MTRSGNRVERWLQDPKVRFSLLLVLSCLTLIGAMGVAKTSGCSQLCGDFCGCSTDTEQQKAKVSSAAPHMSPVIALLAPQREVSGDGRVHLALSAVHDGDALKPARLDLVWTPPAGAQGIQFDDRQPEAQRNSSFMFRDVPVNYGRLPGATDAIAVSYQLGSSAGTNEWLPYSTLQVRYRGPDGQLVTYASTRLVDADDVRSSSARVDATGGRGASVNAADYYFWHMTMWGFRANPDDIDTSLCEELVASIPEGNPFIGVRFPVPPGSETFEPPIVLGNGYYAAIYLLDEGQRPYVRLMTQTLELKPQYVDFLENELPSAPDEHWMAIGRASTEPITCPEGLDLPAGTWEIGAEFWLDMGGAKDACESCQLTAYLCFDGELPPAAVAIDLSRAAGAVGAGFYQSSGITCIGPQPHRLTELWGSPVNPSPSFALEGWNTATVDPGQVLTFTHKIQNLGSQQVTVDLSYLSAMGISYGLYQSTYDGPRVPLVPMSSRVTLGTGWSAGERWFSLIAAVPSDARGAETVWVTATSATAPDDATYLTDGAWIGPWAPPTPEGMRLRIRLPLVLGG